jgi:hypothetical protein
MAPLLALLIAAAPAAQARDPATAAHETPRTFAVLPGSTLSYHLVHKFHTVTGVSRIIEGKARLLPDGTVQVMVRAPLESFDSGNSNRDEHMLEVTDAARNPYVVLKGVGRVSQPSSFPSEVALRLQGELTLKTTQPVAVPMTVRFEAPDRASIDTRFPVSLEQHGVERPSLLFVKVDDRIEIEAKLRLEVER